MTYSIVDGAVVWEGKPLGPAAHILVDSKQADVRAIVERGRSQVPATVVTLPVGDYVFVSPSGLLCIVEEKRRGDLATSYRARRLQRQLRNMREHGDAVLVLGLRAGSTDSMSGLYDWRDAEVGVDIMKWQVLGGLVGVLPEDPAATLRTLRDWQGALQPGRHLLSVLAGDDKARRAEHETKGLTPTARALSRLIKGVGPTTAAAWAVVGKEDLLKCLRLTDKQLTKAGLNKTVRAHLKELLDD